MVHTADTTGTDVGVKIVWMLIERTIGKETEPEEPQFNLTYGWPKQSKEKHEL
jgi:hypothetical protein